MTEFTFKPPIFVVGTPRSGTTLTARILGNHPHLFMPGETQFMHDIYARRSQLGDPQDPLARERILERLSSLYRRYNSKLDQERFDRVFSQPDMAAQLRAACTSYAKLFNTFMDLQARYRGKIRWGNNSPKDVFHVEEILELFPDAKIIFCVRDIRDFLLSYKGKWRIATQDHQERLRELYHPVLTSLLWKATMRRLPALQARVPPQNFMISRYEDMVKNPGEMIRRMCTIVDESYDDRMQEISIKNSSNQPEQAGIFSSSIGLWKRELSAEEIHIAQSIAGKEMADLGYAIEPVRPDPLKLAALRLGAPLALLRAYRANRGQHGPMLQYLMRRAGALLNKRP
jgi:hypothetical protein